MFGAAEGRGGGGVSPSTTTSFDSVRPPRQGIVTTTVPHNNDNNITTPNPSRRTAPPLPPPTAVDVPQEQQNDFAFLQIGDFNDNPIDGARQTTITQNGPSSQWGGGAAAYRGTVNASQPTASTWSIIGADGFDGASAGDPEHQRRSAALAYAHYLAVSGTSRRDTLFLRFHEPLVEERFLVSYMSDWNTRIVLSIAFGVMMAAAVGTFTGNSASFVVIYVVTIVLCLLSAMVFAVCKYKSYQLHKRSSSSLLSKLPFEVADDPTLHIPHRLQPNTVAAAREELINSSKSRSRTVGGLMNQQPQQHHHQHHRHHHHNSTKSADIRMNELATVTELVTAFSLYLSIILYTANISFAKESCLGADNYATSYDQCYKLFNFDANSMMMVLAASVFAPIRFLFHILFVIAVLIAFSVANSLQSNASYVKERFFSSLVILAGQQIACAVWLYRRERDARDAFTMECVLELQNRERSVENAFARCFASMADDQHDEEDNNDASSSALLPFVTLTAETWMGDTARYAAVPSQQHIYHTPTTTTTTTKSFASQQQLSSMISNRGGGGGVGGATTTPMRAFVTSEMLNSAVQVIHAAREVFDDNNQHHNNNSRQDELYNGSSGSGASERTADSGPSTLDALTTSPTTAIGGVVQNSSSIVDKSHALPKGGSKKDASSAFVTVSLALGSANVSLLPAACATIISGAAVEECQEMTRLRHTTKSSGGNNRSEQPQRRISASSLQFTVSDQGVLSQREEDFIQQQQQQEPQRYGPQETLPAASPTPQPFVIMSGVICSPAFSASLQGISSSSSKLFTTRAAKTATNPLETLLGFPVTFIAEEEAAVAPPLSPGGPATPASFRPAGGPPGSTRTNNIAADGFPRDIEQELRSVVEAQLADQRQQQQQQQQQLGASSNNNRSLSNRDDGAAVNEVMPQETFALRRRSWFHCLAMEFVNAHVEQEFRHHQSNLYEPAALIMHSFEMIGLAGCMFFISGMYHVWSWEARSSLPYVFSSGCSGVLLFVLTKFVVEPTVVSKRSHLIFLLEFTYWAFMFSCVLTSIMPPQDQSIFSGSVVPWMYVGATVSLQRPRWFPPVGQWLLEALFCVIFVLTAVLPIRDLLSSRIFIQALIGVAMLIFSLILRVLLDAMDRDRYAGRMVLEETQTILEKEAQHLLNLLRSMAPTKEAARRLLKRGRNRGAAVEAMLLAGGTQNARRSTSTTSFVAPVRVMTTNVEDLVFAVLSVKQCRPQQVSTSNSYQQPGEISSSVRSRRRSSASTTTISAPPPLPSLLPPATEGFTWCSFSHNILIDVHDCVARCLPAHKAMIVKSFGDCFVFGLDEGELANLRTLNRAEVVQRMVACMQDVTTACQTTIVQCLRSENVETNNQEDVSSRRRGGGDRLGGVTTDKKSQVYSSSNKNSQAMSTSSSVAQQQHQQQQQRVSSFQTGGGSHSRGGGAASILLSPTIEARGGAAGGGAGMLVESFSPAMISPSQQQQQQLFDCNGIGRGDSHSSQLHFHHAASSGRGGGGSLQQVRQNNNALDGAFSTFDIQPHPASSSPKFHICAWVGIEPLVGAVLGSRKAPSFEWYSSELSRVVRLMSSPNSGFQAFVPDPTPWGGSTRTSMPTSTIILSKRTVAHLSFDRDQGLGYRRSEQQQQQSQKSTTVAAQGSDYYEERIHMLRLSPIAPTLLKFSELCSWRCEGLGKVSGCMLLPLAPHEGGQDDL